MLSAHWVEPPTQARLVVPVALERCTVATAGQGVRRRRRVLAAKVDFWVALRVSTQVVVVVLVVMSSYKPVVQQELPKRAQSI
jgi:uncharacterized membrane protein